MAYVGVYAPDGGWNVTVVPGTSYTGLYAADGSLNVIESPGNVYVGAQHPCGALWVTLVTSGQHARRAADGSLNIDILTYPVQEAQDVYVVSGTIVGTGGGTGTSTNWFFLILGD